MMIEVRDESAELVGHLDLTNEPDVRRESVIIPYSLDGLFTSILVLPVDRVRLDGEHWVALRANVQHLEILKRLPAFQPITG